MFENICRSDVDRPELCVDSVEGKSGYEPEGQHEEQQAARAGAVQDVRRGGQLRGCVDKRYRAQANTEKDPGNAEAESHAPRLPLLEPPFLVGFRCSSPSLLRYGRDQPGRRAER